MEKLKYAKDFKCCNCKKKAVCFWPIYDPDIPSHPYCRKCVDESKMRLMIELGKIDKKYTKK